MNPDEVVRQGEDELAVSREKTIPVIEETARTKTIERTTGRVRVTKSVSQRQEALDLPVLKEEVDIERVPVNEVVERPPQIRTEDGTIIVPILEEILVIEKQILLKEELHIRKRQTERIETEEVTLRSEDVTVERTDLGAEED